MDLKIFWKFVVLWDRSEYLQIIRKKSKKKSESEIPSTSLSSARLSRIIWPFSIAITRLLFRITSRLMAAVKLSFTSETVNEGASGSWFLILLLGTGRPRSRAKGLLLEPVDLGGWLIPQTSSKGLNAELKGLVMRWVAPGHQKKEYRPNGRSMPKDIEDGHQRNQLEYLKCIAKWQKNGKQFFQQKPGIDTTGQTHYVSGHFLRTSRGKGFRVTKTLFMKTNLM